MGANSGQFRTASGICDKRVPSFHFSNIPSFQKHRMSKNLKELLTTYCL
jgi:hypothetical protein